MNLDSNLSPMTSISQVIVKEKDTNLFPET